MTLPCKHIYHASCVSRWLGINKVSCYHEKLKKKRRALPTHVRSSCRTEHIICSVCFRHAQFALWRYLARNPGIKLEWAKTSKLVYSSSQSFKLAFLPQIWCSAIPGGLIGSNVFFFSSYMFSQWKYLLRFTIIECNRPFEMDFLPSDCLSIEARFHVETCSPLLSSDVELFMEFCSIFFNACHAAFCPVCLFLTKFCVGDLSWICIHSADLFRSHWDLLRDPLLKWWTHNFFCSLMKCTWFELCEILLQKLHWIALSPEFHQCLDCSFSSHAVPRIALNG